MYSMGWIKYCTAVLIDIFVWVVNIYHLYIKLIINGFLVDKYRKGAVKHV